MKNADVARVLNDIADLLELKGENVFKVRAYQKAARSIEHLPTEVERLVAEDRLKGIPGVGEAIARKTTELVTTGKLQYYEDLKKEFPEGISTLLDIPGVGPKTAMLLSQELGIKTIEDLEAAIREGKVAALPRMGEKTAENILHAVESLRSKDQRIPIGEALPVVDEILGALGKLPGVKHLTPAGSLRRFMETVGDLDLMGTADDPQAVIQAFVTLPSVRQVLAGGPTEASVVVTAGLQVDLRLVEHDSFGSLLQYFTGSKQHNIDLREKARRSGLKLSEYGIMDNSTGKLHKFATEEDFYHYLGMQYIPPEIREATGEIELAEKGTVPRLVEPGDIRGDVHVHSKWSDGRNTIKELAMAARELGYDYIAITDHSYGRGIARGLNAERLVEQIEEIDQVNREITGIRVLTGSEVDIRADGNLDLPGDVLRKLDFVVASVHSGMNESLPQMTRRVVKALESGLVNVLAHPTCRLLRERPPVALDMEAVFQAALRTGTTMEINAMPDRLDLKDTHAFRARELGVKLAISTDTHDLTHFGLMRFGIGVARRGWCEKKDILNTLPLAEFQAALKKRK